MRYAYGQTCCHIMTNIFIYLIGGICGAICFPALPGHKAIFWELFCFVFGQYGTLWHFKLFVIFLLMQNLKQEEGSCVFCEEIKYERKLFAVWSPSTFLLHIKDFLTTGKGNFPFCIHVVWHHVISSHNKFMSALFITHSCHFRYAHLAFLAPPKH